jgi:hypothetical protein
MDPMRTLPGAIAALIAGLIIVGIAMYKVVSSWAALP